MKYNKLHHRIASMIAALGLEGDELIVWEGVRVHAEYLEDRLAEANANLDWIETRHDNHATHSVVHIYRNHERGAKPTLREVVAKARAGEINDN